MFVGPPFSLVLDEALPIRKLFIAYNEICIVLKIDKLEWIRSTVARRAIEDSEWCIRYISSRII